MSLYSEFLNNKDRIIHKWLHYFPIYERYFSRFVNQSILFYEIGVFRGGSARMWKKYLGPYATFVGIDIDPTCRDYAEEGINIEIGDQKDKGFLQNILHTYGTPDIVLDDGSHIQEDLWATFEILYPELNNNGVYFVEDLHTCYWPKYNGAPGKPDTFIERSKHLIDELNAWHYKPEDQITSFTHCTHSIAYYDSICVFEKMKHGRPIVKMIGNQVPAK